MKSDPLAICLVFACSGILADRFIGVPAGFWLTLVTASLILWFVIRFRFSAAFVLLGIFAAFGFWHHVYWNRFASDDIGFFASPQPQAVCLRGKVVESASRIPAPPPDPGQPLTAQEKIAFTLQVHEIRDGDSWQPASGRAAVYVGGEKLPKYGDSLMIFGTLSAPQGRQNPDDFDSRNSLKCRRILAVVYVDSDEAITVERKGHLSLFRFLESVRRNAQTNLKRYMNQAGSPLAAAMILGFREDIPEETQQTMLETGTIHILAISGMHVALIAGCFVGLFRILMVPKRRAALLIAGVILFYFCLTDMRPPVLRATMLICVASFAVYFFQRPLAINSLCITAFVVLVRNPTDLFQFGAQMSFLATSAFLWCPSVRWERGRLAHTRPKGLLIWLVFNFVQTMTQLFVVSLCITAVSLPLIVQNIHLITPVGLLVNPLLWIPLTVALLGSFATMVFAWIFPPLAVVFGGIGSFGFMSLEKMLDFFHAFPYGHHWSPAPPAWWMVGFYTLVVIWTLFPLLRPQRKWIFGGFALWCLVGWNSGYVVQWERQRADRLEINVLSVGHGLSVFMLTPEGKAVIYDAGCFSRPILAANTLSRRLWKSGKSRIDAVVLSHADTDHYNAVPELAERFAIGAVYVSPYMFDKTNPALEHLKKTLREKNIPIRSGFAGILPASLQAGSLRTQVLHPPPKPTGVENFDWENLHTNSMSLVLLVEHRGKRILLPGDLETKQRSLEIDFLRREPILCDVLAVPHHGGNSNLTEPLLDWCKPETLFISGGKFTYKPESVQAFRDRGYRVFHTLEDGFIRWIVDKNGESVETPLKLPKK
ncbi:MAG: ComEC/Rec2 family competence protein [Planctomycetaceae bacterium]|nr:ComEC/Rec2 family competence protein [Planctomycetaceae bacterium]